MKDNKLVLISGSGRGVGASIARSFVEKDYQVAINFFQNEKQAKLCLLYTSPSPRDDR